MFPLPLSCLEELMFFDDRPAHPMTGVFRLRFSGFLERDAFEAAWRTVVERHPLLRATVSLDYGRRPVWIDRPDWEPVIHWQAEPNSYGFPNTGHIDLTREPGACTWIVERADGHDAIFQVHHAGADALGMAQVIEDLLVAYALRCGATGDGLALAPLDQRRMLDRGAPGLTPWKFLAMAHRQAVGLLGVREFLFRSPVALAGDPPASYDQAPTVFPSPQSHDFDVDQTRQIIARAKALRVTVNDLLARDLFLALASWRAQRAMASDREWLRFSIPINLRQASGGPAPMANSVSSVFLDRRPCDMADSDRLLKGIHEQMNHIKRMQLQYTFILSLALARLTPGGLARRTRHDLCQATTCFSNLGAVLGSTPLPRSDGRVVAGNVVLDGVDFVIPLRPHWHAAFCVYTYAGRLRVLMHADPRIMPDDAWNEVLQGYVRQIGRSIATA